MAQPGSQQLVRVYDQGNIAEAFQREAGKLLAEGWVVQSESTPAPGQLLVIYTRAAQRPTISTTNTDVASSVQKPDVPPMYFAPLPPAPNPQAARPWIATQRDYGLDHLSPLARALHTPKNALIGVGVNVVTLLLLVVAGGASSGLADVLAMLLLLLNVAVLVVDGRNAVTFHGLLPLGRWFQQHPILLSIVAFFLWPYALGLGFVFGPLIYFSQCYQLSPRLKQMEQARLRANIASLEAELLPGPGASAPPQSRT